MPPTQPPLRTFIRYASLNVLGMLGLSCYILADTFFIANGLGADGLAALNLAIPIYSFVHGTGLMLGMGGAIRYSLFQNQNPDKANSIYSQMLCLTAGLALLFSLAGLVFSAPLARRFGASGSVFSMTRTYILVILLFAPAFLLNELTLCFVRNDGNPRLAMAAMLTGSLANILFDYIFIFPLDMGIFGAVLATGLAPVISLLILSLHRLRGRQSFRWTRPSLRPAALLKTLALGFPSFVTEAASGLTMLVFNAIFLRLSGNIGVAAYGIIANLSLVILSIFTGIVQGAQPLISQDSHSPKSHGRPGQILRYAAGSALALSLLIYLGLFLGTDPIIQIFNSEHSEALRQAAASGLRLYFLSLPFAGLNLTLSMYFAASGRARPAHLLSLLRGLLLMIPLTLLLSWLFGAAGLWLASPITELLTALLGIVLYRNLDNAVSL